MRSPLIYVSRMEVIDSYFEEFMTWCKTRHWPDVIGVGFLSANGYISTSGTPRICNVYEIPGVEVFSSAYDAVRESDEQLKVIVSEKISAHSLTVYSQLDSYPLPERSERSLPSLSRSWSCPAMSGARFELPTTSDRDYLSQISQMVFGSLAADPRLLRVRILREFAKHPTYPSPEPAWSVLVEWANLAAAEEGASILREVLTKAFGTSMTRLQLNVGREVFSLRHPNNWKA